MNNGTAWNGQAHKGHFLSRAGVPLMLFRNCCSPKEKKDGTAWRGFDPPAYLPVIPASENDKERHGTTWNGNAGKGPKSSPSTAKGSAPALLSSDGKQMAVMI
jgi:hypothetical protein